MACTVRRPVKVEVSLNVENQTREKIFAAISELLQLNGAIECGLMGAFSITLGEGSDMKLGPELAKQGVTSLRTVASD